MARESQGLTIALVIFVLLTLVLSVVAFFLYKQADEAQKRAIAAEQREAETKRAADSILNDNDQLKRYIGVPTTMKVDEIGEVVRKDFEQYAPNFPGESRDYRSVLQYVASALKKANESLAAAQAENEQLKAQIQQLEASKTPLVQQERARADQANSQLMQERAKFQQERQALQQQAQEAHAKLVSFQDSMNQQLTQLKDELQKKEAELKLTKDTLQFRSQQLRKVTEPEMDVPDGKVRWVNQRNRTVWINLGSADGVRLQMLFSVYPSDTTDITKAKPKGSIEVTEILESHLAEARILEDQPSDPIMPGDLIYTPLWSPGEKVHFALTDGLDLDNDGKSDLQTVINIIEASGGVVDCYIDDEGNRYGKITAQTRYLVMGEPINENMPKARRDARTQLEREADAYGLTRITLAELLTRTGWKRQIYVLHFTGERQPGEFRARPPKGGMPVSSGNVSPLYQPRRPPARQTPF